MLMPFGAVMSWACTTGPLRVPDISLWTAVCWLSVVVVVVV